MRQLVLTGGDVLSAPEVSALESSGRELRSRVDQAQERTSKLLRRLESARDELGKLRFVLTFSYCILIIKHKFIIYNVDPNWKYFQHGFNQLVELLKTRNVLFRTLIV